MSQSHRETLTKEHVVGGSGGLVLKKIDKIQDETILVLKQPNETHGIDLEPDEWIKDSGCSKTQNKHEQAT
ncbi:hypothetical protein Tco_0073337 [Tanacetum coccineum]